MCISSTLVFTQKVVFQHLYVPGIWGYALNKDEHDFYPQKAMFRAGRQGGIERSMNSYKFAVLGMNYGGET